MYESSGMGFFCIFDRGILWNLHYITFLNRVNQATLSLVMFSLA